MRGRGAPPQGAAQVGEGRPGFGAFVPGEGEGRLTLQWLQKNLTSSAASGQTPAQGRCSPS